jgi:hypothetical protein
LSHLSAASEKKIGGEVWGEGVAGLNLSRIDEKG